MTTAETLPAIPSASWRELVMPKEHGSWSLAFEPIALGLLCAPSLAGGCFAGAVAAAFFCRRPIRIALRDDRAGRRRAAWGALMGCAALGGIALAAAGAIAGAAWLAALVPSAMLGALFLVYDLKNDGREEVAELAGTTAFALLPAAFGLLAGWSVAGAAALAAVMVGRAVPTVIFVRAAVRGRKRGEFDFTVSLAAAAVALGVATILALRGSAPVLAAVCCAGFLARIAVVRRHPGAKPKTLGLFEAAAGVVFVVLTAATW